MTANSQIDATKVLQNNYETHLYRSFYAENFSNYRFDFNFRGETEYLGTYKTIDEAIRVRNKFIDSLK